MLINRCRTELMGMYFKSIRIQLRCEVVFMMLFSLVGAELMGMYFKYTRIQLRCEVVFMVLFNRVGAELMGMNSWGCISNTLELNYAVKLFFHDALQSGWNWTHGDVFKSIRIQLRCEAVFMVLFTRVGTELMGMYFKYISIQLRCEVVFRMLRADITCHATSTPCTLTEPLPFTYSLTKRCGERRRERERERERETERQRDREST